MLHVSGRTLNMERRLIMSSSSATWLRRETCSGLKDYGSLSSKRVGFWISETEITISYTRQLLRRGNKAPSWCGRRWKGCRGREIVTCCDRRPIRQRKPTNQDAGFTSCRISIRKPLLRSWFQEVKRHSYSRVMNSRLKFQITQIFRGCYKF